jgi:3-hydroxyisobutyrate dehydrogenase-like beta-hydroxyacid dehydrogenase
MSSRVAARHGKMRAALARRLAEAGFEMTLWNRTRSRAEEVGVGHVVATSADAVRAAEVVISSLTGLSQDAARRSGITRRLARRAAPADLIQFCGSVGHPGEMRSVDHHSPQVGRMIACIHSSVACASDQTVDSLDH